MPALSLEHGHLDVPGTQTCVLEQRANNNATLLGRLPSELVVKICEDIVDPTKPRTMVNFMHICSRIYYSVISAPHLWTSLHWMQSINWQKMSVTRSNGLPLRVDWKIQEQTDENNAEDYDWMQAIFPVATAAKLHLYAVSSSDKRVVLLWALATHMRNLEISSSLAGHSASQFNFGDEIVLGGHSQHLTTLELNTVVLSTYWVGGGDQTFAQWYCPAMRHLKLVDVDGSCADYFYMICAMPLLEVLEMQGIELVDHCNTILPSRPGINLPFNMARLQTLHLRGTESDDTLFVLSLMPNPSTCFYIDTVQEDDWHFEWGLNTDVVSRLQDFWQTTTGARNLPVMKATFSMFHTWRRQEDVLDCVLSVGAHDNESASQDCGGPALFWRGSCKLDAEESIWLIPMVSILEFDIDGFCLDLQLYQQPFDIYSFPNVRHVIIKRAFKASEYEHKDPNHDKQELLQYLRKRMDNGKPLSNITFVEMEPLPAFTQTLLEVGGPNLNIVWK
jgi:hypothetical protein